jgi:hypothetical protein
MRRFLLVEAMFLVASCGGGGQSTPRSTPTSPPPAQQPSWTLAGQVLDSVSNRPVAGARIATASIEATTDADGRFTLSRSSAPTESLRASVTADGHIGREATLGWPRPTPDLLIDVISTSPPFSLKVYQQLVRNSLESTDLYPVYRWTTRPRVALVPFDDSGRPVPPEVLDTIRSTVPRAAAAWSGGAIENVTVEDIDVPDWQEGWIVVHILRQRSSEFCGLAQFRFRDPGRIVTARVELTLDKCSCGSRKISPNTISHELGHAMGFWHVAGRYVLAPVGGAGCSSFEGEVITPTEAMHAAIAYRRPPGNRDPDTDPDGSMLVTDGSLGQRTVICR